MNTIKSSIDDISNKSIKETLDIVSGAVTQCCHELDSAYATTELVNLRFPYSRDLDALLIEVGRVLLFIGKTTDSDDWGLLLYLSSLIRAAKSRVFSIQEAAA